MTRSPVGVLLCIFGLLSTIGLAGCGGTETGNPAGPGGGGGDRNPAIELGGAICDKLAYCFGEEKGFTEEDCEQAIVENDTLGPAFGVDEEPPPGYGQVIDWVENSELSADEEVVAECLNAIDSLECEDESVLAVGIEEGFANVEDMIPEASCSQIFSAP
jgi:hypothetical protein